MPESRFQQLMESPSLARSLSFPGHKAKVVGGQDIRWVLSRKQHQIRSNMDLLPRSSGRKNSPGKEVAGEND
jgi:hypothetical protein